MRGICERVASGLGAVAVVWLLSAAAPVRAQIPFLDPATEHTQFLNHIELALQVEKMIKQIEYLKQQLWTQIDMFEDMKRNSLRILDFDWGHAADELKKIHDIFEQSRALAYTMKDLEKEFRDRYKDYAEYSR